METKKPNACNDLPEDRYRDFIENISDGVYETDIHGNFTYFNNALCKVLGYPREAVIGENFANFMEKKNVRKAYGVFTKIWVTHEGFSDVLWEIFDKDGQSRMIELSAHLVRDKKNKKIGFRGVVRDVTEKIRDQESIREMTKNKEALLRISTALPAYPGLESLLDYISEEIRVLMNTEDALVILLNKEKDGFSYVGAAYNDVTSHKKIKTLHLPVKNSVAGKVVQSGEAIIVSDPSSEPDFYYTVDKEMGFKTRNMIQVPMRSSEKIIGVLCARNKKEGDFDQADVELLTMITGTVALSIENARFSEELREAYREVSSLNRAKDKVINHLSHELKTPASILMASIDILAKRLKPVPEKTWKPAIERARRNLDRILDIQYQAKDIMENEEYKSYGLLSILLEQCTDELEALVANEVGEELLADRIRKRIEEIFGARESISSEINLQNFVGRRLEALKPRFGHREVEIGTHMEEHSSSVTIPSDVLQKTFDGLVRNAIENTPDEGKVTVSVRKRGEGVELKVHDYGVGIVEENQERIFEGFFVNRDTMAYSTKRPFDFNAGGKGSDLLRMKIFSERYDFKLSMHSSRCGFIPKEADLCPGRISECSSCKVKEDCAFSGETTFVLFFPACRKKSGLRKKSTLKPYQ